MADIKHRLVSVYYTMIVWMKSDRLLGNFFMNLLWTFRVSGFKLFPIMPTPYIIDLKVSEKPYKLSEVENLI